MRLEKLGDGPGDLEEANLFNYHRKVKLPESWKPPKRCSNFWKDIIKTQPASWNRILLLELEMDTTQNSGKIIGFVIYCQN